MRICEGDPIPHKEIVHEGSSCPACDYENQAYDMRRKVEELEEKNHKNWEAIESLQAEVERLMDRRRGQES